MARPTLLFALAATILSLAASPATAAPLKPPKHHNTAAPPPAFIKHPANSLHAPPHSAAVPSASKGIKLVAAPSPVEAALPPEPYPGFYEFAERCLDKLTEECGLEIFQGIFWDDGADVSDKCCRKLVAIGRGCHRGILKATLTLPGLPKREKKVIKMRDVRLWSRCILVTNGFKSGHKYPSPSSSVSWSAADQEKL